jgi:CCR4-NOT transcription complex subunit 1
MPGIEGRDGVGGSGGGGSLGGTPMIPGILSLITLRSVGPLFHRDSVQGGLTSAPPSEGAPAPVTQSELSALVAAVMNMPNVPGVDPGSEADEVGGAKANLRNLLALAVDTAVRELIQPVVERSVTIAVITTRELVKKDYAPEPDADKVCRAAQSLSKDLARSLAVSTCIDLLKDHVTKKLRELFVQYPIAITSLPVALKDLGEDASQRLLSGLVEENLEAGTLLIETAATENAQKKVDIEMAQEYEKRRSAAREGRPWVPPMPTLPQVPNAKNWAAILPEMLR